MAKMYFATSVIRENEEWMKEIIEQNHLEVVRKQRHDNIPLAMLGGAPYPITVFTVTGEPKNIEEFKDTIEEYL